VCPLIPRDQQLRLHETPFPPPTSHLRMYSPRAPATLSYQASCTLLTAHITHDRMRGQACRPLIAAARSGGGSLSACGSQSTIPMPTSYLVTVGKILAEYLQPRARVSAAKFRYIRYVCPTLRGVHRAIIYTTSLYSPPAVPHALTHSGRLILIALTPEILEMQNLENLTNSSGSYDIHTGSTRGAGLAT
jgi:hypothetical protein